MGGLGIRKLSNYDALNYWANYQHLGIAEMHRNGKHSSIGGIPSINTNKLFLALSILVECDLYHCFAFCVIHLSCDCDLNLNTSLDVDDDLLDNLGRGVKTVQKSVSGVLEPRRL